MPFFYEILILGGIFQKMKLTQNQILLVLLFIVIVVWIWVGGCGRNSGENYGSVQRVPRSPSVPSPPPFESFDRLFKIGNEKETYTAHPVECMKNCTRTLRMCNEHCDGSDRQEKLLCQDNCAISADSCSMGCTP